MDIATIFSSQYFNNKIELQIIIEIQFRVIIEVKFITFPWNRLISQQYAMSTQIDNKASVKLIRNHLKLAIVSRRPKEHNSHMARKTPFDRLAHKESQTFQVQFQFIVCTYK